MGAIPDTITQSGTHNMPVYSSEKTAIDENEQIDNDTAEQMQKECNQIASNIFEMLSNAVDSKIITAKDCEVYMKALSNEKLEEGGASTWEKKKKWLKGYLEKFAPEFIAEAQKLTSECIKDIEKAKSNGWITEQRANYWLNWIYTNTSIWPKKRKRLKIISEKYMGNWKNLAAKSDDINNKIGKLKVSAKEIPELKKMQDPEFENMQYKARIMIVNNILTQIALFEDKNKKNALLHTKVKTMLEREVKLGVMRKDQSAQWLEALFNRKRSPEEIENIIKGTLSEYVGEWSELRYRFDRILRRMEKGVPQGINKISEKEFLNMTYPEKKSYIQETEYALNLVKNGPSNRPIDKMKLEIRSLIAQKDWEGARAVLKTAEAEASGEDMYELNSMRKNIEVFGEEEKETGNESAEEVLNGLRNIINTEVPSGIQTLYVKALSAGPQVFASLSTLLYNRVWCWNHGHLSGEKEEQKYKSSIGETMDIIQNGHNEETAENVNMNMIDNEHNVHAIDSYDKKWKPTLIHLNASDGSACSRLVSEIKGQNQPRDYWTTLIVNNISYEKQSELEKGVNYRLKSGIRKLHRMGFGFSLIGDPPSLN